MDAIDPTATQKLKIVAKAGLLPGGTSYNMTLTAHSPHRHSITLIDGFSIDARARCLIESFQFLFAFFFFFLGQFP